MKKQYEYTVKLLGAIQECFNEDSDHYIDKEEFLDDNNATAFIHALANIAPMQVYEKLTGDKLDDNVAFNHIANRLCFQFSTQKDDEK